MMAVYLVRHSERIDEVDQKGWKKYLERAQRVGLSRNIKYLADDPIITERGKHIAAQAGEYLSREQSERLDAGLPESPIKFIFSSRLVRCVQTSYEIAKQFNVPIVVSQALALTALAVRASEGKFEFCSLEELQALCPGIPVYSCDKPAQRPIIKSSKSKHKTGACEAKQVSTSSSRSVSLSPKSDLGEQTSAGCGEAELDVSLASLPLLGDDPRDWLSPLLHVAEYCDKTSQKCVIVCHRETIRNLSEVRCKLPYCAIGKCEYHSSTAPAPATDSSNGSILGSLTVQCVNAVDGSVVYSSL